MPAYYRVVRFSRATRRMLAVVASGLTMEAASRTASGLRVEHAANEAVYGFQVETMSLEDQATLAHVRHPALQLVTSCTQTVLAA
ncbi:MAG: hypothetical protein CL433_13195 [Acidimicrobiaceae bacterium]|nr:hypothetical protein [Acidimicrobiaceae bacterium]